MSYVGQGPGLKTTNIKRFDVTGSTSATHVLSWTAPSEQTLWITINGVKQQDDAYTIAGSPTTVTLSSALVSADKLEIIGVVDMGVSTYPVDGSVSTASLGNTSVTTAKIAADAVTAAEIATGAVGTTEIAANAVTLAEMAGLARGKLIVGDASGDPSALAVGTSGQYLTSDGTDASWGAVVSLPSQTNKGGYTLITDGTDAAWASRPNRNIIINGNFNVWQRGTSFAAIANATYAPDRFFYEKTGAMVHTITRDADVPTQAQSGLKSLYSMKVDCTTVDASIAAGDFCNLVQRIEGYNFSQLEGNTGTISFWVKATKTGTYCVSVISGSSDRSYVSEYTVSVADTWEKKTATIVFNYSGGGWNYSTGIGLQVKWALATGSNYQGVADTWNSAQDTGTSNQVNACDSTSNNFFLSQVQLEVSPTATPFEHKTYGQELYACKRYFRHVNKNFYCYAISGSVMDCFPHWEQEMRANPSCTLNTTTPAFYEINVATRTGSGSTISTGTFKQREAFVRIGGLPSLTTNTFRYLISTENMFSFSAEL